METDKNVTKFYMMIGLPGSGKSTLSQKYADKNNGIVLSSDAIREEVHGEAANQSAGNKVFNILNHRTLYNLSIGKNVIYDACNISRGSREQILNLISKLSEPIMKIAVVVSTPYSYCILRDKHRDRTVSEPVINHFLNLFEFPLLAEGFDDIIIEHNSDYEKISFFEAYEAMTGFDQKNPHHSLDLKTHCEKCQDYVLSKNTEFDVEPELAMAALLHDYGKLYTASWDDKKQCNHYYNHENVGAYKLLTEFKFPEYLDIKKIIFYINYHMLPYKLDKMKETKKTKIINQFQKDKFLWSSLNLLHEGDEYAH